MKSANRLQAFNSLKMKASQDVTHINYQASYLIKPLPCFTYGQYQKKQDRGITIYPGCLLDI
jgi:hypothetical protein